MSDFVEHNRRAWNEVHARRHAVFGHRVGLAPDVLDRLEALAGARVLHLQCATGETTAQLVRRGAAVVAVDIAEEALAIAAATAPGARFVAADVHALPDEVQDGSFDLVVTEGGVVVWLHDLTAWAAGVVRALRPDGRFVLAEEHPVAACLDGELRWVEDYFDESVFSAVGWEHFELPGAEAAEASHERFWRLGQLVTALARAGLRLEELEERPGGWRGIDPRVPGSLVLVARKA